MTVRWPPAVDRPLLAAAAALWLGVVVVRWPWLVVAALSVGLLVAVVEGKPRAWLVVAALAVGLGSGTLVTERHSTLEGHGVEPGRVEAVIEANSDVIDGPYGAVIVATAVEYGP